jgi:hypothetical protein
MLSRLCNDVGSYMPHKVRELVRDPKNLDGQRS